MTRITKQNFLTNKFSRSNTNKILKILNNFVDSGTTANELINLLTQEADEFCWYVGHKPAYHVQYQIDSVAILRINGFVLIVWKPKYIEYPSMVQFPDIKQTKKQNIKVQIDQKVTNLSQGNRLALTDFLQKFIATYVHSDESFEANLCTYAKHFISKKTAISYWHSIYDDANQMALKNIDKMECVVKINVSGVKKGYNKCLLLFSCKGSRDNVFTALSKKWMQVISFLAMVMIFLSVVGCSSGDTEGICQYRDEVMVGGAGLMMALFGLKMSKRIKNKPNSKIKTN